MTEQINQETRDMLSASLRGERVDMGLRPKEIPVQAGDDTWNIDRILFLHNGHEDVINLRGGPAFTAVNRHCNVRITQTTGPLQAILPSPYRLFFVTCPGSPVIADLVCEDEHRGFPFFIVDVTGPLLRPEQLLDLGQREAAQFWMDDEHQASARRAIAGASLVTVPDEKIRDHVLSEQDAQRNVMVLPDYHPGSVPCRGGGDHAHATEQVFWFDFVTAVCHAWVFHNEKLHARFERDKAAGLPYTRDD
jgi:hypothetical protein